MTQLILTALTRKYISTMRNITERKAGRISTLVEELYEIHAASAQPPGIITTGHDFANRFNMANIKNISTWRLLVQLSDHFTADDEFKYTRVENLALDERIPGSPIVSIVQQPTATDSVNQVLLQFRTAVRLFFKKKEGNHNSHNICRHYQRRATTYSGYSRNSRTQ